MGTGSDSIGDSFGWFIVWVFVGIALGAVLPLPRLMVYVQAMAVGSWPFINDLLDTLGIGEE